MQGDLVKSHTHTYSHTHGYTPSGKIASSSGGTNNATAGMSGNATGSVTDIFNGFSSGSGGTGNVKLTVNSTKASISNGSTNSWGTLSINVAHTHTAYFTGTEGTTTSQSATTTLSNNPNATENRPSNYTMIIWKRIA